MVMDLREDIERMTEREAFRIAGNKSPNYHPRFSLPYFPIGIDTVRANVEIEKLKKLEGPKTSIHEPYDGGSE